MKYQLRLVVQQSLNDEIEVFVLGVRQRGKPNLLGTRASGRKKDLGEVILLQLHSPPEALPQNLTTQVLHKNIEDLLLIGYQHVDICLDVIAPLRLSDSLQSRSL
jgi:hypothetical protein